MNLTGDFIKKGRTTMDELINQSEELWDIYDEHRRLTGKIHRRGLPMEPGQYRLAVHVCIFNSKNELLIQQRQTWKSAWPAMWDVTIAGSAMAGETSQEAAEREALEELGLKLDLSGIRPHFTMNFAQGFDDYYLIEQEVDIASLTLQEEEVRQVKWVSREELMEMYQEGKVIPYYFLDSLFACRNYYGAWSDEVAEDYSKAYRNSHEKRS